MSDACARISDGQVRYLEILLHSIVIITICSCRFLQSRKPKSADSIRLHSIFDGRPLDSSSVDFVEASVATSHDGCASSLFHIIQLGAYNSAGSPTDVFEKVVLAGRNQTGV